MQQNERTPIEIRILELPYSTKYLMRDIVAITFSGLLCEVIYDDGSKEFLKEPYIDCDRVIGEYPGIYKIYVYLDEKKSYGIYATFKIQIEDLQIVERMYENIREVK